MGIKYLHTSRNILFAFLSLMTLIAFVAFSYLFVENRTEKIWFTSSVLRSLRLSSSNVSSVFCWITTSSNFDSKLAESWMKFCDGAIYFQRDGNSYAKGRVQVSFPVVSLPNESGWLNTVEALTYINGHFLAEFDWFITAGEDTYVKTENLRSFLREFNESEPHYFGYSWTGLLKTAHTANYSDRCPVKCLLHSNRAFLDQADAVTFFMHPNDNDGSLPTIGHPWQRYVFFNIESYATGELLPMGPLLYNWSMTYERDSDVRLDYYGQLLRHTQSAREAQFVDETARNKTKMVAWLVSNCYAMSGREAYVNELRKFVSIDQFGRCPESATFPYSCQRNPRFYGYWCNSIPFTTEYRFYLAVENAVCRDYVTEKFFQALDRLMVPIVLRKADYLEIAPSGSYIAVDQFRSPKDLVDYLQYLARNIEEYLKYFEYTKTNRVAWQEDEMISDAYCRLCRMLHENRTSSEGSDLRQNWHGEKACVNGFARKISLL